MHIRDAMFTKNIKIVHECQKSFCIKMALFPRHFEAPYHPRQIKYICIHVLTEIYTLVAILASFLKVTPYKY